MDLGILVIRLGSSDRIGGHGFAIWIVSVRPEAGEGEEFALEKLDQEQLLLFALPFL